MQGLERGQKLSAQRADLAGGQGETVLLLERGADLFALAVLGEAAQADERHHVVAHLAARNEHLGDLRLAGRDPATFVVAAPRRTHVDRLASFEVTMRQGVALVADGLLHGQGAGTQWTGRRGGVVGDHPGARRGLDPLAVLLAEGRDRRPQRRERLERERTVFFTW